MGDLQMLKLVVLAATATGINYHMRSSQSIKSSVMAREERKRVTNL